MLQHLGEGIHRRMLNTAWPKTASSLCYLTPPHQFLSEIIPDIISALCLNPKSFPLWSLSWQRHAKIVRTKYDLLRDEKYINEIMLLFLIPVTMNSKWDPSKGDRSKENLRCKTCFQIVQERQAVPLPQHRQTCVNSLLQMVISELPATSYFKSLGNCFPFTALFTGNTLHRWKRVLLSTSIKETERFKSLEKHHFFLSDERIHKQSKELLYLTLIIVF